MIIVQYFLYFIIYSCFGWILEVTCKSIEEKRFINRGYLIGPICSIYGFGVTTMILLIGTNTNDLLAVFLKSILVCSILEYATSYIMEKMFHARWWDYSRRKYNINGRTCLETMIPFGILGTFTIYIAHPFIKNLVNKFPNNIKVIIATIILILYIIDNIISYLSTNKIKKELKGERKDNTEYIRNKVLKSIEKNAMLYKKIKFSYPDFTFIIKEIKKKTKK